jgi:hypothetical protein
LGRPATLPALQRGASPAHEGVVAVGRPGRPQAPGARLLLSAPKTSPPAAG